MIDAMINHPASPGKHLAVLEVKEFCEANGECGTVGRRKVIFAYSKEERRSA